MLIPGFSFLSIQMAGDAVRIDCFVFLPFRKPNISLIGSICRCLFAEGREEIAVRSGRLMNAISEGKREFKDVLAIAKGIISQMCLSKYFD